MSSELSSERLSSFVSTLPHPSLVSQFCDSGTALVVVPYTLTENFRLQKPLSFFADSLGFSYVEFVKVEIAPAFVTDSGYLFAGIHPWTNDALPAATAQVQAVPGSVFLRGTSTLASGGATPLFACAPVSAHVIPAFSDGARGGITVVGRASHAVDGFTLTFHFKVRGQLVLFKEVDFGARQSAQASASAVVPAPAAPAQAGTAPSTPRPGGRA